MSIKKSLQHINNMLIYEHKIYSRSIKKECKIILNIENFFEKINFQKFQKKKKQNKAGEEYACIKSTQADI